MELNKDIENKDSKSRSLLLRFVKEIGEEQGFEVTLLESSFKEYFVLSQNQPDRCVDGRKRLIIKKRNITEKNYKGIQIPGASLGILDSLIVVTKLDENISRDVLLNTYKNNGILVGAHIDDEHGHIVDTALLIDRYLGCGNQKVLMEGKLAVFEGMKVDEGLIRERFGWVRNNGSVIALTGEHKEKTAVVNLVRGTTFDTESGVENNSSVFNCDLAEVYFRAGLLFDYLKNVNIKHKGPDEKDNFQEKFTKAILIDYLQTLSALGAGKILKVNAE